MSTSPAPFGGDLAINAVVRVICPDTGSSGTGFIHASGNVITAEHVIRSSMSPQIRLPGGAILSAKPIMVNPVLDIALLDPATPLSAKPLPICGAATETKVGDQVASWGFPAGYAGTQALLCVGHVSGLEWVSANSGVPLPKLVINAAFNAGNSGGPLIDARTGEVLGVVTNKLAPLSKEAMMSLDALKAQTMGNKFEITDVTGQKHDFTEGQLVGKVLDELRAQIQLVIGYATTMGDLRTFLTQAGVTP